MNDQEYRMGVEADAVLRLGTLLMIAGSSGYRVMRGMKRAARALGFDELDLVVGVTQITCTFHKGQRFRTVVSRTHHVAVDASRIEAIEYYAHHLNHRVTAEDIHAKLDEIEATVTKRWSSVTMMLAAGLACSAFGALNHFNMVELVVVALAAALGQLTRILFQNRHIHQLGAVAAAGAVAVLSFFVVAQVLRMAGVAEITHSSSGYVAAVLFLIPGFPLFSAMIDLARFDFEAGLARLTYALTVIMVATFCVGMLSWMTGLNPAPRPVAPGAETQPIWILTVAIASFIGISGFAVLFNSSRRMILVAACIGSAANLMRFAILASGATIYIASFVAGLAIGMIGAVAAKRAHLPRVTTTVPASVILIPGTLMFQAVYFLNAGNMDSALASTATAALVIVAISAGLVLARMLTDRDWTLGKLIDLHKDLAG